MQIQTDFALGYGLVVHTGVGACPATAHTALFLSPLEWVGKKGRCAYFPQHIGGPFDCREKSLEGTEGNQ